MATPAVDQRPILRRMRHRNRKGIHPDHVSRHVTPPRLGAGKQCRAVLRGDIVSDPGRLITVMASEAYDVFQPGGYISLRENGES